MVHSDVDKRVVARLVGAVALLAFAIISADPAAAAVAPSLLATASGATMVGLQVFDNVNLAGGSSPTGTVTFSLFGPGNATCAGTPIFSATTTVAGNGPYNSAHFTTTEAGTYQWEATYSGDANNNLIGPTSCSDPKESVIVGEFPTGLTTTASAGAQVGGTIHDTAMLAGFNPTGTLTFQLTLVGAAAPFCSAAPVFTAVVAVSGNGSYPSPDFTPTTPGTYAWQASYSGDANNFALPISPCLDPSEAVIITPGLATPIVGTTASGSVPVGGAVSDTASVIGGNSPAGSITFSLYGPNDPLCANVPAFTSTTAVIASNASSGSFTTAAVGTYLWTASYSGDANNNPSGSGCGTESVVVTKATNSALVTQASGSVMLGGAISDSATLSGGFSPTGTLTFNLFASTDTSCTGTVIFTATTSVTGDGSYPSGPFIPTVVGTYRWVAAYSGDANTSAAGPTACNDPAESVVVTSPTTTTTTTSTTVPPTTTTTSTTVPPTTTTTSTTLAATTTTSSTTVPATTTTTTVVKSNPTVVTAASAMTTVGGTISDIATLSGGTAPTGTITFSLFGPNDPTCSSAPAFTSMSAVAGNGSLSSGMFTTAASGTYLWTARYSGDAANNAAVSACGAANESVVVSKSTTTVVTKASSATTVGGTITDTATLTGGFSPTGTITFTLFGPNDATCAATAAFTSIQSVSGNGGYTSAPFTTTAAGTYRWVAAYSGDANSNPAGPTSCGDAAEAVVVSTTSTTTTSTTTTVPATTTTTAPATTTTTVPATTTTTVPATTTTTVPATTTTTAPATTTTTTTVKPTTTTSTSTTTSTTTTTTTTTVPPTTTTTTVPRTTTTTTVPPTTTTSTTTTSTTIAPTTSTSTSTTTAITGTTTTTAGSTTTAAAGPTVQANPFVVAAGQSTTVAGRGFPGGSNLLVTLFSNPVLLGTTTADQAGNYAVTVTVPASTTPGAHTLVVAPSSGSPQAQTAVTVTAAVAATTATTGTLSFTGADIRGWGAVALMLMLAGLLSVGATRRRRRFDW